MYCKQAHHSNPALPSRTILRADTRSNFSLFVEASRAVPKDTLVRKPSCLVLIPRGKWLSFLPPSSRVRAFFFLFFFCA